MSRLYFLLLGLLFAVLDNVTPAITCPPGYEVSLQDTCIDEDECEYENPICGVNAVCYNTNGSYYCQCVTGYRTPLQAVNFTADDGVECEDINECLENKTICGPNAECTNTHGPIYCMCRYGFVSSTGQERFNAGQSVTCRETPKSPENKMSHAPDAEHQEIVLCIKTESSAGQQQFNPTVLMFLPLILWIRMFYQ